MRVLIASTFVPFVRGGGGAGKLVDDLRRELTARGYETDTVLLPVRPHWRDLPGQTAGIRLLDLTESCGQAVDRLITVRTPAYALRHPNKVAWFIHHHREAYDLWGTPWGGMPGNPVGVHYRNMMRRSDDVYLRECRRVFTNSRVVADRLRAYNRLEPDGVLYPPLETGHPFRPGPYGDYILYVSRLTQIKRQQLAVEALRHADPGVRLVIAGAADDPAHGEELDRQVRRAGVGDRVRLTGWVSEEEKAELTAGCCAALYLAYDEDSYGYSTLEAFHAHKPVITLTDSGGSLEVVQDGENGLVCPPDPRALAEAMNRVWRDRRAAERMGGQAHRTLTRHRIDWDHVVENLVA